MKTIKLVGAFLATALLASCDLDVLPPTSISPETYWSTDKDAWYALNTCYKNMPGLDIWDEMTTDNAHSHKPWEGNFELVQNGGISTAATYGSYNFSAIRNVNTFLANVDKCTMDANVALRMKAEARVLRALAYMRLTAYYGKVAIIEEALDYDAPLVARNSVSEVQAFILKELEEAAANLPVSYSSSFLSENSRVTKGAAYALRARAALYFGNYPEAESSAKKVMDLGVYSLFRLTSLNEQQQKEADEMDLYIDFAAKGIDKESFAKGMFSYEALWQKGNATASNPEFILFKEYANQDGARDTYRFTYMVPLQMSLDYGFSSFEPMQDLIDAYWDIDGKTIRNNITVTDRKTNYEKIWEHTKDMSTSEYNKFASSPELMTYSYMDEFKNRDSRLYASMMFPFKGWHNTSKGEMYYKWNPAVINSNGNESWTGYSYRKIVSNDPVYISSYGYNTDPYPIIRYAEVLLTFAEARLMNSGYDSQVQSALNDIRNRCGMPNVPTGLSNSQAVDLIRNERRIELAAEGHRYNDIRRYGTEYATKYMTGPSTAPNGSVVIQKAWNDKLMLMPIPQSAIDKNVLLKDDQNPGY